MIKKIMYTSLGLTLSTLSYAGTMGQVVLSDFKPKENFYAGVGFGGNFNRDTEKVTALTTQISTQQSNSSSSVVGNLLMGYGHTWLQQYFLGIEANTYFPGHSVNITTQGVSSVGQGYSYVAEYTFKDYLGLDLLPGIRFRPNSLIYARTGLSFRDIEVSQIETETPPSFGYYHSGHSVGGRFGAGVAHGVTEHIGVAIDYFYTYYPTWGAYWSTYNLQQEMASHQNYLGISLTYTS